VLGFCVCLLLSWEGLSRGTWKDRKCQAVLVDHDLLDGVSLSETQNMLHAKGLMHRDVLVVKVRGEGTSTGKLI